MIKADSSLFKSYYYLTKPGIIYGNAITAIAGFLFASGKNINFGLLVATVVGISLVIGSACVFNNYIDRKIDRLMQRTQKRALVTTKIPVRSAIVFACSLGLVGFAILLFFTNHLVVYIGLIAFIDYVILYGITKRKSVHGTLVGSISGAAPILAGYCAVSGQLNTAAVLLFIIMLVWQMPHFYAIAIYRYDDYAAAKLPVLPVKKSIKEAKVQIVAYVMAYIVATIALYTSGSAGTVYLLVILIFGLGWLWMGFKGFKHIDNKLWAKQMFRYSLIIVLVFSVLISINPWVA